MVAVNLPTPWLVHGGRAKDAEKVIPFPKKLPVAGDFPQHLVELHDIARRLEATHAQAHPEQLQRRAPLGGAHLIHRQAVSRAACTSIPQLTGWSTCMGRLSCTWGKQWHGSQGSRLQVRFSHA